jgi:hypothetical protein
LGTRIKERGYWQTSLRPKIYKQNRLRLLPDAAAAVAAVQGLSVQLRGWDFPHIDPNSPPQIEADSVGQETEWEHFVELWRIFASGQFFHLAGMRHDWGADRVVGLSAKVPATAPILGVRDAVWRFTEVAAFAGAYARDLLRGEGLSVEVTAGGLRGRRLVVDSNEAIGFSQNFLATTQCPYKASFEVDGSMSKEDLLQVAREHVLGLYALFGYGPSGTLVEDWQSKLGRF